MFLEYEYITSVMFKWVIFLIFILAFILRVLYIPSGSVSFHYDMARDAYEAQKIWKEHHLKILGPPTSTPGLYHGVLYYYLIAPFYGLGRGDPRVVAIFLSIINSLTIIPVMLLTKSLFKKNIWVVLSGVLYAVSFEATQYGSWVSNPAPAVLTVALFFLGLRLWQEGKSLGLYLATLAAALSTQFQFFLIYLFALMIIFKFLFKVKVTLKQVAVSSLLTLGILSSFFISAIKFDTLDKVIAGIVSISTISQFNFRVQFSEVFLNYLNRFADIFINNFLPTNIFLGGLLAFIILYLTRENRFVLFGLLSNMLIFIFGGHNSTFANVGMIAPAILAFIIFLQKIGSLGKIWVILFAALVIFSNVYTILRIGPSGQLALVIPKDMVLSNELKLVDKTYEMAKGQPFSISTLTLPLWANTTWAYLYSWYGKQKYGYVPSFYGHNQVGLLGKEVLEKIDQPLNKTFFIIEPHVGIPDNVYTLEIGSEDSKTEIIEEIKFGDLRLQSRKPIIHEE